MPGPHGGMLRTTGVCAFCDAPTRDNCRLCGRSMCADHAVEGESVCIGCGGTQRVERE